MTRQPVPSQPLFPRQPPRAIDEPAALSFKWYEEGGRFCLSKCGRIEIKQAMACLRKLTTLPLSEIGRGGLNYKPYPDHAIRGARRPAGIDPGLTIGAVRVSGKFRLFGVFGANIFYVLWFDRNHEIVSG